MIFFSEINNEIANIYEWVKANKLSLNVDQKNSYFLHLNVYPGL